MGNISTPLTLEQTKALGYNEVSAAVRLYHSGKIDQWWYRQDGHGVSSLIVMVLIWIKTSQGWRWNSANETLQPLLEHASPLTQGFGKEEHMLFYMQMRWNIEGRPRRGAGG